MVAVKNLILRKLVVTAVQKKRFHFHPYNQSFCLQGLARFKRETVYEKLHLHTNQFHLRMLKQPARCYCKVFDVVSARATTIRICKSKFVCIVFCSHFRLQRKNVCRLQLFLTFARTARAMLTTKYHVNPVWFLIQISYIVNDGSDNRPKF